MAASFGRSEQGEALVELTILLEKATDSMSTPLPFSDALPLQWIIVNVPDGSVERLWAASREPSWLILPRGRRAPRVQHRGVPRTGRGGGDVAPARCVRARRGFARAARGDRAARGTVGIARRARGEGGGVVVRGGGEAARSRSGVRAVPWKK